MSTPAGLPDEAALRALLPRAWHAFFGRFGRLNEIQRRALGPIVAGERVLVGAPTASGKTEAVMAPLAERALDGAGLRLLVVSPTRALVNDLFRRLERPLGALGLKPGRKTADAPAFDPARPPDVLITTPESLDSLLARHPGALRGVGGVFIDEAHLLARSIRGDQLRCLLARLDRVAATPAQRCGASATVPDTAALAVAYLGAGARWITTEQAHRPISARLVHAPTEAHAVATITAAWPDQGRKLLVFANSRGQVEGLGAALAAEPRLGGRVFAHHGSLARGERLRVERAFLDAPAAICVATMTLELGIDIGDIDLVVLVAPPPDVSSLLQRVGRGGRRGAGTRVIGLYGDDFERRRFEHLLSCAAAGRLFDEPVAFRPSVLPQQALSLAFQNPTGWVSARVLHDRLPPDIAAEWTLGDVEAQLAALVDSGELRAIEGGRYVPDEPAKRRFERGKLHSLLQDPKETEVIDAATGRAIGRARFSRAEREKLAGGARLSLSLAGRRRDVHHVRDDKVFVHSREGFEAPRFIAREAPRYSAGLARDLAGFLGFAPDEMRLWQVGDQYVLYHFLGTIWGHLLAAVLRLEGHKVGSAGAFELISKRPPITPEHPRLVRAAGEALRASQDRLNRLLGAGPFAGVVPTEQMARWARASVDLDGFVGWLSGARLVEAPLWPDDDEDREES